MTMKNNIVLNQATSLLTIQNFGTTKFFVPTTTAIRVWTVVGNAARVVPLRKQLDLIKN